MPEHYTDQQILGLAEGVFGVEGMRPRHQRRVLQKKHDQHNDHPLAPVYLRHQHSSGSFLEMRPAGDNKTVEFTLHAPGVGRNDFAISKGDLGAYTDTQREHIMHQLKAMYLDLHELQSVRVAPAMAAAH